MGMDHYLRLKDLGGTNGAFLAVDKQDSSKRVVIKRLADGIAGMEELNATLRVRHENIIQLLESFIHDSALYVVTKYEPGGDLESFFAYLKKVKRQPTIQTQLQWFLQLLRALSYCHEIKIIHRDIKPGNIFLSEDTKTLYLGDFGSAKAMNASNTTATFVGSPMWISPEVLLGRKYTFSSDIWSLGCVFYEMASLRHPFTARNFASLVSQVTAGEIAPLPDTVPVEMKRLITSMLTVDSTRRPTAMAALHTVEQFVNGPAGAARIQSAPGSPPPAAVPVERKTPERRPRTPPPLPPSSPPQPVATSGQQSLHSTPPPAANHGAREEKPSEPLTLRQRLAQLKVSSSSSSSSSSEDNERRVASPKTPPKQQRVPTPKQRTPKTPPPPVPIKTHPPVQAKLEEGNTASPSTNASRAAVTASPTSSSADQQTRKRVISIPAAPASGEGGGANGAVPNAFRRQITADSALAYMSKLNALQPDLTDPLANTTGGNHNPLQESRTKVVEKRPPAPPPVPKRAQLAAVKMTQESAAPPVAKQDVGRGQFQRMPSSGKAGAGYEPIPGTSGSSHNGGDTSDVRPSVWFAARNQELSSIEDYLHKFRDQDEKLLHTFDVHQKAGDKNAAQDVFRGAERAHAAAAAVGDRGHSPLPARPSPARRYASPSGQRGGGGGVAVHVEGPNPANRRRAAGGGLYQQQRVGNAEASGYARLPSRKKLGNSGSQDGNRSFGSAPHAFHGRQASNARHAQVSEEEQHQTEEERQQARQRREAERQKMKEMIREQRAKARKEHKRADTTDIPIVLPDKQQYTASTGITQREA